MNPYDRLLTSKRFNPSSVTRGFIDEEAESDRGRVLYCSPFRRLQDKAQVFSLESNAAVRSRLTHSLEVSTVGRRLASQAIRLFEQRGKLKCLGLDSAPHQRAFVTFTETACMLHDIGNPPFGHFGELAISDWFHDPKNQNAFKGVVRLDHSDQQYKIAWDARYTDFERFDGNPQGLRIVAKLQWNRDQYGLNLTLSQLAGLIKYPISAAQLCTPHSYTGPTRKKAGFFSTEQHIVQTLRKELFLAENQRHPIVYLMEAADDISYCLSDIEDGAEKGICAIADFASFFMKFRFDAATPELKAAFDALHQTTGQNALTHPFLKFRTQLTNHLVNIAAKAFVDRQNEILAESTSDEPEIFAHGMQDRAILDGIKLFAENNLYGCRLVRQREITAYATIRGILDAHLPLLLSEEDRFSSLLSNKRIEGQRRASIEASLLSRMPKKHIRAYQYAVENIDDQDATARRITEWNLRAHLVVDYISGMTDRFAVETFQLLSGVDADVRN